MSHSFVQLFGFTPAHEDEEDEREQPPTPPWFGPADDELGVAVPLGAVIGRSDTGAVALRNAIVYSEGVTLAFLAAARGVGSSRSNRLISAQHRFEPTDEPTAELLKIGIELPGGERLSNLGGRMRRGLHPQPRGEEAKGPVFFERGGGGGSGGGGRVSLRPHYWLWPLPNAGTIRVSCEWPAVDIPLSTVEIDAGELAVAAERVVSLWPSSA